MLGFYKVVLGPVLLMQASKLRRTALRLPEATGPRCGVEIIESTEASTAGLRGARQAPLRILPAAQHPLRWYLGRYAAKLDNVLRRWIGQDAAARYVSLDWAAVPLDMARDRFHPGAGQYRRWAELVSEQIMDLLAVEKRSPAIE